MCRSTTLAAFGLALTPAAAVAGPTFEVASPAPSASARVGGFHIEPNAIKGSRGAGVVFRAGDRAGHNYCNPAGAGTRIAAANVLAKRWHSQTVTGVLRVLGEGGVAWSQSHAGLGYQQTHSGWVPATARGCVTIEWLQTGQSAGGAGWNPIFTAQLTRLRIEDLQGPAVSGPSATTDWITGASARISWSSSDNAHFRGATGASVGGRESSAGNAADGAVATTVDVARLGDGPHAASVWRRGTGWPTATAPLTLRIDRTPPIAPRVDAPTGWLPVARITAAPTRDATSGWRENQYRLGSGPWSALPGDGVALGDGVHAAQVRAVDVAGNVSAPSAREIRVDATAPVAVASAEITGPGVARIDLAGTTDATSGVARWVVRRGGADGPVVATSAAPKDLLAIRAPDGTHAFHLRVEDRAGNAAEARTGELRFDSTAPTAALTRLPSGWIDGFRAGAGRDTRLGIEVGDERPDGLGPVQVQLRQDAGWKVIARYNEPGFARLDPGAHLLDISLDVPGVQSGPAEIRVVAMDPGYPALRGVTPSRRLKLDLDGIDIAAFGVPEEGAVGAVRDGASGALFWDVTSDDGVRFSLWDLDELAPPRLRVSGTKRTRRYRGGRIPVRLIGHGRRFSVVGRIAGPLGGGLAGVPVLLRDPRRRTVARGTTGAAGRFVLRGRASRGGLWAVEAVGRGRLLSRFQLRVRPRLGLAASRRRVAPGGRIVFKGAVKPRSGSYAKIVQLQFRDGRRWRPFANARIDRKGRYRFPYVFRRAGGYSVQVRAVMLRQANWPFTPAATRPLTVRVRSEGLSE